MKPQKDFLLAHSALSLSNRRIYLFGVSPVKYEEIKQILIIIIHNNY